MKGTEIETTAILEHQGIKVEFNIVFDYDYTPAIDGNRSGHPDNWTPDEPEDFEFTSVLVEIVDGSYVDLPDEDIEKIAEVLEEVMRNDLEIEL